MDGDNDDEVVIQKPRKAATTTATKPAREAAGPLRLVKAGTAKPDQRLLRMLVFGPPGAGKTHFATSYEDVVILELEEQGVDTIESAHPDTLLFGSGARNIAKFADVRAFIAAIQNGNDKELREIDAASKAAGRAGLVVAIDSAFELQNAQIDDLLDGKSQMTKRDWGNLAGRQRTLYRSLRAIPYHLVVLSLVDWTQDDERGRQLGPLVKGGLSREIGGYFNLVAYAYKRRDPSSGNVEHYLITEGSESLQTKPFGPIAGVVTPDLGGILAVFTGRADVDTVLVEGAPLPIAEQEIGEKVAKGRVDPDADFD